MQCKSCGTELPKKAKVCPRCGAFAGKQAGNVRVLAIIGLVIAFIAGMLPFVQSNDTISDAYSFMNISVPVVWYLFMLALIVSICLIVAKKNMLSIIPTAIAVVIFVVAFCACNFYYANTDKEYSLLGLMDNGEYGLGCGVIVFAIGIVIGIVGLFIDVLKFFKKDNGVDTKYLTNSINKRVWTKVVYYRGFYIMFLPVLIMVLLFNYWPMLGCRFAFTKYVIRNPYYVGLKHFSYMLAEDNLFWNAFKNTLFLSIVKLILNTGGAVIISLLLNEISALLFKKAVQTIVYLPHFMSWVVVCAIFGIILSVNEGGMVNELLKAFGILKDKSEFIYFLGTVKHWTPWYFVVNLWKDTGWGTILFLATLSGISPDLYEAAQIDGANRFKRLIYITLPALANTIITVFILNLAKVMNLFESVFVMQNPAVQQETNVLQTYVYYKTFTGSMPDYGYTTAVGLFKSFVGMILVLSCNWASKKVRGRGIV